MPLAVLVPCAFMAVALIAGLLAYNWRNFSRGEFAFAVVIALVAAYAVVTISLQVHDMETRAIINMAMSQQLRVK